AVNRPSAPCRPPDSRSASSAMSPPSRTTAAVRRREGGSNHGTLHRTRMEAEPPREDRPFPEKLHQQEIPFCRAFGDPARNARPGPPETVGLRRTASRKTESEEDL